MHDSFALWQSTTKAGGNPTGSQLHSFWTKIFSMVLSISRSHRRSITPPNSCNWRCWRSLSMNVVFVIIDDVILPDMGSLESIRFLLVVASTKSLDRDERSVGGSIVCVAPPVNCSRSIKTTNIVTARICFSKHCLSAIVAMLCATMTLWSCQIQSGKFPTANWLLLWPRKRRRFQKNS